MSKKKILVVMSIFFIFALNFCSKGKKGKLEIIENEVTKTKTIKDYDLGYSISYPSFWKMRSEKTGPVFFIAKMEDLKGKSTNIPPLFTIIIRKAKKEETLAEAKRLLEEEYKKVMPNFELNEKTQILLSGKEAVRFIFSGKHGNDPVKTLQVFSIQKGKVYLLTFMCLKSDFDLYRNSIDEVVESFKILK